ncbi:MAG TPA: SDR family oxidoreductase [Solirubrobacteraceae bacterium]|jgi:NAD(P)-dependent dehydrogenase (short-subunit alcohol dehydrogenase family)|nr:SDR family oxidoreductase [Solirubrobacteraceae bacterium]
MSELLDFGGRTILVTGASRGIGREVARALAELGARVVALARDRTLVQKCVAELAGGGHRAVAIDVGDEHAWRSDAARAALEGVDGVVAAAALLVPIGPIGTYAPAEFWHTMRVNVLGTLLAIHACLPSLEATGGAVVTFSGGGGTSPQPRYDAYATSKAAVVRLTENLARELAARGVRVNAVSPGFVATDIHAATLGAGPELTGAEYFASTERQLVEGAQPIRRAAELTAFLLDEAAAGISGRVISAQWDPWREQSFRERLRHEPDLATLRRIDGMLFAPVPKAL